MTDTKTFLTQPSLWLPSFSLFVALGAMITLSSLISSPSDPKNALFLGYSAIRLTLIVGMLILTATLLFLTWKLLQQPEHSQHWWERIFQQKPVSNFVFGISAISFLILWILLFTPSYRLAGNISEYAARLYPVLVWLAVVSAATTLISILLRKQNSFGLLMAANRTAIRAGIFIFLLFLLAWIVVSSTGIGIRDREDYWYGAGVPALGLQVLFSLLIGGAVLWLEANRRFLKNDVLVFVLFWAVTAWLWVREPLLSNYFMPDTAGNIFYPYSDSATFDIASQWALIGQGLFGGLYFDRALYSAFLTYLHALAGQDYAILMAVQAAVFAVFPAIVYLIGRELHSRALGISAGMLIALRGVNSIITAKWIDTASPKMMLTDFPTAIGVALLLLFALKWMKNPSKLSLAVWAGGALGMTVMLRTHVFLLLPVIVIGFFIYGKSRWKVAALGSFLLVLGMLSATLPWDIRNRSNNIPLFYAYYSRIELILRERYGFGSQIPPPQPVPAIPGQGESSHARTLSRQLFRGRLASDVNDNVCNSTACSIANHFFHNLITSVLFLPNSPVVDDLWNTVKLGAPYWKQDWTGQDVGGTQALFLGINLLIISFGVGMLWERNKPASLLTMLLFLMYSTTNSFGFTSGGRYIVSIDWLVGLFFMAGLLQAVTWFLRLIGSVPAAPIMLDEDNFTPYLRHRSGPYLQVFGTLALTIMMGALIPLADSLFEKKYQERGPAKMLNVLEEQGWLEQAGFEKDDVSVFLEHPQARLVEGRLLYPRYYPAGVGELDLSLPYMPHDYPRLAFTLIAPSMPIALGVVVSRTMPGLPAHTADVVVIGCAYTDYYASSIDALAVIVLTEPPYIQHREPGAPLQCPLE
ncbi:MAG: hypothetical protein Q8L87_07275 [Anaerolineales bacterium]|nr:hypothetical protein [Anaerolineales bacterium]